MDLSFTEDNFVCYLFATQDRGGSSMAGEVFDTYVAKSHTVAELKARNAQGAGRCWLQIIQVYM